MKLYSVDLSPYAARVRISVYAKGLPVEIVAPPADGIKSDGYRALNPMARIPVLVRGDGTAIPESETIVEYLEDAFPDPALRPESPEARAKVRLIARVAELYVLEPVRSLFGQLDPSVRNPAVVQSGLTRLGEGLEYLEGFMADGLYAAGASLTTADGAVTPALFFVNVVLGGLDALELMSGHTRLNAHVQTAKRHKVLGRVIGEMADGMQTLRRRQS